jgi:large subunit ribosomal protein L24
MRKIKKGDSVMVMAGKDKGKIGKVLRIDGDGEGVVIEKLNIVKRHSKPSQSNQYGGIIEKEAPLHISNVAMLTKDGKPTRVSFKLVEGAEGKPRKVRYSVKYNETLD